MRYSQAVHSEAVRLRVDERLSYTAIAEKLGIKRGICAKWLREFPVPENQVVVINKVGNRYGRLVVIKLHGGQIVGKDKRTQYAWECLCDCGNLTVVKGHQLVTGRTKSCGCFQKDRVLETHRTHGRTHTPEYVIYMAAKTRAKQRELNFNIELDDVVIPNFCPVFNIPLTHGTHLENENSPSLDRIDNNKGYVKGNVWVISRKANTIKNNASLEELKQVVLALESRK